MADFEAFRYLPSQHEGKLFTQVFLSSYDFDTKLLGKICKDLGLQTRGEKAHLVDRILTKPSSEYIPVIMKYLIRRSKTALAIRYIPSRSLGLGSEATELIEHPGKEIWYGPIHREDDPTATWYIHPIFLPYQESRIKDNGEREVLEYQVRWLCFARVSGNLVSIHWHGFSYKDEKIEGRVNAPQLAYWRYIPTLFSEMEELLGSKAKDIRMAVLILYTIMDQYRNNPMYLWGHSRIRAETAGVAFHTRASSANLGDDSNNDEIATDKDMIGVKHLAATIRSAIERRLKTHYDYVLPNPEEFDEEILTTLIRRYGTKSYEVRLQDSQAQLLLHVNCYFGAKRTSDTADSFQHFQFKNVSKLSELKQLEFLLSHFDKIKHVE